MANHLDGYETVDHRLHEFWNQYPNGRVETEIVEIVKTEKGRFWQVLVYARVYAERNDERAIAGGYAEEVFGSSHVNSTSFIENAETSAIGRALANAGFSTKGLRPSREEMEKAERVAGANEPTLDEPVTAEVTTKTITKPQITRSKQKLDDDPWSVGNVVETLGGEVIRVDQTTVGERKLWGDVTEKQLGMIEGLARTCYPDIERGDRAAVLGVVNDVLAYLDRPTISEGKELSKANASRIITELKNGWPR